MNPGPGTSWLADLHNVDGEQVQLDLAAIITRGARLRRRRLLVKLTALAALLSGLTPAGIATLAAFSPAAPPLADGPAKMAPALAAAPGFAPAQSGYGDSPKFVGASGALGHPLQVGVRLSVTLPRRYGPLRALTGAPEGTGVWFTSATSSPVLFHLSLDGAIKSWPVPRAGSGFGMTAMTSFAIAGGGIAWLAGGSTLIRVNTVTNRVSSWQIPAPATNPATAPRPANGPVMFTGQQMPHEVTGLAATAAGRVAVVMSYSSSVQVFDAASDAFEQIPLPAPTDQPQAVGFTRSGSLGVAFSHLRRRNSPDVLIVAPSGRTVTARVADVMAVAPYGPTGLLVGTARPAVVSAAGKVRPLNLPTNPPDITAGLTPPIALPDNRLGVIAGLAVLTFPAAASSVAAATAGSDLYLPPPGRCGRAEGRPKASTCHQGYRLLAIDAIGDIWVVPATQTRTIELLILR